MSARFVIGLIGAPASVPPVDSVPVTTVVPSTDPVATVPAETVPTEVVPTDSVEPIVDPLLDSSMSTSAAAVDMLKNVFEALGDNGYQTGCAIIVATVALVALINLGTNKIAIGAVTIGAFWAGWLGWNTFTSKDNQLFPGEIQATKLWDVAFTSDIGFLFVAIVSCLLAALLWRKGISVASRIAVLVGGVLGASLMYNLYESFRAVSNAAG